MRKKILIFGGTGTIGFSIAKKIKADGFNPVIIARDEEELKNKAKEIDCDYSICDVLELEQIEKIANDQSLEVGKGQKVEISKDQDIKIGGDMTIKISKGKGLIDAKKEFKIKVGSSTITIKPTGIELKAAKITLNAKTKVDVKATAVTVDAKAKVDIKAKAAINVDAKGQTKVAGAMVEVAGKGMVTIKGGVIMAN